MLLGDIRRMRFPQKLDKTRRHSPDAAEKRIQAVQMPGAMAGWPWLTDLTESTNQIGETQFTAGTENTSLKHSKDIEPLPSSKQTYLQMADVPYLFLVYWRVSILSVRRIYQFAHPYKLQLQHFFCLRYGFHCHRQGSDILLGCELFHRFEHVWIRVNVVAFDKSNPTLDEIFGIHHTYHKPIFDCRRHYKL